VARVKPTITEVPLRDLVRVLQERYGVNPNVLALATSSGPVLRIAFSKRQRDAWLDALDQALQSQGRALFSEGEGAWHVRPA